jgi:hypothetical protein
VTKVFDFYLAAGIASAHTALANRLDPSMTFLSSSSEEALTIKAIAIKSANTGYVTLRLGSMPVFTCCVLLGAALIIPLAVEIPIPVGAQLTVTHYSSSGTAYCSCALVCDSK